MDMPQPLLFTGITKRRWTGFLLVWLAVGLLFLFLYLTASRSILGEIRSHVMGVAIATAAGLDPEDLEAVRTPADAEGAAFRRVQNHLDRISSANSDIRYIYTMRRDMRDGAAASDFLYVVDQPADDSNGNGVIDPDEVSETPGNEYDASLFPQMIAAWDQPAADFEVTPDPPYPDLISGYAPVKNARGTTVAVVGVDMTAGTVRRKYVALQAVTILVALVLCMLLTLVVQLYDQQREALERNKLLSQELASRNEMLRGANLELTRHNERFREELKLAENVQQGFLPVSFPRKDRIQFDKFYLSCEILGGDLFDVFAVGQDHLALYMADVAGHGVSAALISGLLKMAVSSVREKGAIAKGHLRADLLQPEGVLATLNEMLVKEIPDYEFITMVYAVLDLTTDTFSLSSAGHPPPLFYGAAAREARFWNVPTGTALGLLPDQTYPVVREQVKEGDKVLFYTDGLIEALNEKGEEFGDERVLSVMRREGHRPPAEVLDLMREAVDLHRGGIAVSDDFSLLVAELK